MKHVLIIGKVWPEPASSAAGSRMMQLIDFFLSQNNAVTFASAARQGEFSADLKNIGVSCVTIELNDTSFDAFVKDLQPAIVVFDRFSTEEQYGWRVAEHCPKAIRILDTEDLHCLRYARQIANKEKREFVKKDLFNDVAKREIASIFRSDLSLIISQFEMTLLADHFEVPATRLHYLPFLLEEINDPQKNQWPGFDERNDFITIGNFLHEPNWDAVLFLKQEIWPLIRQRLPKVALNVYGAYPTQKVFELHKPAEGFLIKGRATNAHDVMRQARVCLAPLRVGAGLKGKLAEAMMCGTPNVTTAVGAEGMQGNFNWSGEIADQAVTFADAAVKLYTDKIVWKTAAENGQQIINGLFSRAEHEKKLLERIVFLQQNLQEQRETNFIGAMLLHHTASSSKYMALWIEAKNKEKIDEN